MRIEGDWGNVEWIREELGRKCIKLYDREREKEGW